MLNGSTFVDTLVNQGYDFFTGVPCSYLTPVVNVIANDPHIDYVIANNEGEAVGIAAGAWTAGRKTVVFAQNSGLGNMINPLSSLNDPFRIPVLLLITWRGQPGINDEPQHALMGRQMTAFLHDLNIPFTVLPNNPEEFASVINKAVRSIEETGLPYALLIEGGTFEDTSLNEISLQAPNVGQYFDISVSKCIISRANVLERFVDIAPTNTAVISTTGKCSRELYTIADQPQHLYLVGSMGCASAVGLGVAINVQQPVVILDGDGAALMHLGNLATIGAYSPKSRTEN